MTVTSQIFSRRVEDANTPLGERPCKFRYSQRAIHSEPVMSSISSATPDEACERCGSATQPRPHRFTGTIRYSFRVGFYRPQTKGKIESGVKYVRRNFLCGLLGREPNNLAELNGEMRCWLAEVANWRVHGTTHEQVLLRFDEDLFSMQPINGRPPYPYMDDEQCKVARDAYVSWQGSRYSVSWSYAGKEVWVSSLVCRCESFPYANGPPDFSCAPWSVACPQHGAVHRPRLR